MDLAVLSSCAVRHQFWDSQALVLGSLVQGRPNPNPMSAKLHCFATKIAVRDSFALGLEQFDSKKLAKVRTALQKEKYFKNIVHFVICNSTQSPIT